MAKKKCFCMTELNADGTCRYRCDPALKGPHRRNMQANKIAKRVMKHTTLREGDKTYAELRAEVDKHVRR